MKDSLCRAIKIAQIEIQTHTTFWTGISNFTFALLLLLSFFPKFVLLNNTVGKYLDIQCILKPCKKHFINSHEISPLKELVGHSNVLTIDI